MKQTVNFKDLKTKVGVDDIAYIHRTGVGYELENAKRQEAYQQYKKQMEEIVSRVAHLVGMAQNYYKR